MNWIDWNHPSHLIYFNNRFNDFFRELFDSDGIKSGHPRPRELKIPRSLLIPKRGSVFDYVYAKKNYGSWHRWGNLAKTPDLSEEKKVKYTKMIIARNIFFHRIYAKNVIFNI